MDIKTQKTLADIVLNANKKTVQPYTTTATVKSITDNTIYVSIPGSDSVTPVKASSVSVNPGDVVDLVVSHNDTHITGNRSDVATSASATEKVSKALEASRLEMDNQFDMVGNKITAINNTIDMQNSTIEMQGSTIVSINDKVNSQNNVIEQQGNTITQLGNTVNQQGNTITEVNNKIESYDNTITQMENTITQQGNDITEVNNKVTSQGNTITEMNDKITSQGNTINSQGNTITQIGDTVTSQGNTITQQGNTITEMNSTIETLNSTVQTQGSSIETLDSSIKIVNSAFVIQNGKLTGISEILTNILDSDYVTTDLLNANVAWIENGKIKEGAIGTVEIHDSSITTAKIAELSADVIKTGTLKTECLILTTDEVDPDTGEKKVALITALNAKTKAGEGNLLDGAIVKDGTIEAAKITVVDLNAFGATIGNFHIGTSSMYNNKTALTDPTDGVYIGTDGIALGQGSLLNMTDDSPFRVESNGDFHLGGKDSNYINFDPFAGKLDINADNIKMGSSNVASESYVNQKAEGITETVEDVNGRLTTMEQNADGFTWSIDQTAIVSSVNEYYPSTSATELTGGSWSENTPTWTQGRYIWLRIKTTNGKGKIDYSKPVCITGNTGAQGKKGDTGEQGPKGDGLDLKDTRHDNRPPSWYIINYPLTTIMEFKSCVVLGLSSDHSNFCSLQTIIPWHDSTGGYPKQTAKVRENGKEYWRVGMSDSEWSPWVDPYGTAVESAKTATNYMKFSSDGLTISKDATTASTGQNVNITDKAVNIRNGSEVLASYGENIILKHNGKDAFTIKRSTLIESVKNVGRYLEATSEIYNTSHVKGAFGSKTLTKDSTYIWHIKKVNKYAIFAPSSAMTITELHYYSDKPEYLGATVSGATKWIPCSYADEIADTELRIDGSIWINSLSDASGKVQSIPPLGIGVPDSAHLEIDSDEIAAKSNTVTPSALNINMEGGAVTFNNNASRALKYQDGVLYGRYSKVLDSTGMPNYSSWYEALNVFGDSNFVNIRLGYGTYARQTGATQIYGNDIELTSRDGVLMPNGKGIRGINTNGKAVNNLQPCNTSNNCVIGYGNYDLHSGDTNIYGNNINFTARDDIHVDSNNIVFDNTYGLSGKNTSGIARRNIQLVNENNNFVLGYDNYIYGEGATQIYGYYINLFAKLSMSLNATAGISSNRPLKTLWSGAWYMQSGQTASLTENVTKQLNGIVLVWSKYSGGPKDYEWNCFFIPKEMASKHPGAGYSLICIGNWPSYKYIYVNNKSITGNAANSSNNSINGVNYDSKNHVLRYVLGV